MSSKVSDSTWIVFFSLWSSNHSNTILGSADCLLIQYNSTTIPFELANLAKWGGQLYASGPIFSMFDLFFFIIYHIPISSLIPFSGGSKYLSSFIQLIYSSSRILPRFPFPSWYFSPFLSFSSFLFIILFGLVFMHVELLIPPVICRAVNLTIQS